MQRLRLDEGRVMVGIANRSGGCPLQFEYEEGLVAHPAGATNPAFDGRVDRLDHAEADPMVAVRGDAINVREQDVAETLHLR